MLLPALLLICINTAWLGLRLAVGSGSQPSATPTSAFLPLGEPQDRMTSAQCMTCHQTEPVLSHPTSITPRMNIPAAFPLENGLVNCVTCHQDTFAGHAQLASLPSNQRNLLRGDQTGIAFCASCHTDTQLSAKSQHPLALKQAHMAWASTSRTTAIHTASHDDGVASCLACHDGTIASDAYGGLSASSGQFSFGSSVKGHPVAVTYPSITLRQGDATFHSVSSIDARVQLHSGQVTCNSCHSLYSPEAGLLVMRNDNSKLCLSCHAE